MLTESTGEVGIEMPWDRDGSFEPQIVRKRQRRLTGAAEIVLSLYAKGLKGLHRLPGRAASGLGRRGVGGADQIEQEVKKSRISVRRSIP